MHKEMTNELLQNINNLIARYPENGKKSALIPILHILQEENNGQLTIPLMDKAAGLLELKEIEVYEVATFYSLFNIEKTGKYIISVCCTAPCAARGGEDILSYLEKKLNIKAGETTSDGLFTLKLVECLGACGNAPVMQINFIYYENLNNIKIDKIIEQYRNNDQEKNLSWIKSFCFDI